jgi:hypothetical protein
MPIKDAQTTNKQHAVPQNIMDVEFKIIGELTLRQFSYLVVFGGLCYISVAYVVGIFKWPLAALFALTGIGLAFVPLEERGLDQWLISFIKAVSSPNQKLWRKDAILPSVFSYQDVAVVKQELITLTPTSSRRKLEEYLEKQDSKVVEDRLDIPEQEYARFVRNAYAGKVKAPEPVQPPVIQQQVQFQPPPSPQPGSSSEPEKLISSVPSAKPDIQPRSVPSPPPSTAPVQKIVPPQEVKKQEEKKEASELNKGMGDQGATEGSTNKISSVPVPVPSPPPSPPLPPSPLPPSQAPSVSSGGLQIIKAKPGMLKDTLHMKHDDFTLSPLTPDRHAGRRFVSLLPRQGSIVLPVRTQGEKVLKTSEEEGIEEDIRQKTEQLNKLIAQIKSDEAYRNLVAKGESGKAPQTPSDTQQSEPQRQVFEGALPDKNNKPQDSAKSAEESSQTLREKYQEKKEEIDNIMDSFKKENERIITEIKNLKDDIERTGGYEAGGNEGKKERLDLLERRKEKAYREYENLQQKIRELEQRMKVKQQIMPTQFVKKEQEVKKPASVAQFANIPSLSSIPNTVSGIIKDSKGTGLANIVVIIKNERGETIRALKTNSLGQFTLVSPLTNGLYNIEIDPFSKSGINFDIISVEAKGGMIPPIEFIGK